ncbi:MAG: hypothetical protein GDA36_10670, partial [Rhodobacteraceae bacterium]|nr:hypothetical protein [Paracoccaceae bacterium]
FRRLRLEIAHQKGRAELAQEQRDIARAQRDQARAQRDEAFKAAQKHLDYGSCIPGGYCQYSRTSVVLGFLPTEWIADGLKVQIEISGQMHPARVISMSVFDPDGQRLCG